MESRDIFSLEDSESHVRKSIDSTSNITLSMLCTPPYNPSPEFIKYRVPFIRGLDAEILFFLGPLINPLEEETGLPTNIYTALYEAIRNAFQHGNQKDLKKPVHFYIKKGAPLEFLIEDQGGSIDPLFASFILLQRQKGRGDALLDFYAFAQRAKPEKNNGTGTSFIFQYSDRVFYYRSNTSGLIVHIIAPQG